MKYTKPEIKIVSFSTEDIITASGASIQASDVSKYTPAESGEAFKSTSYVLDWSKAE